MPETKGNSRAVVQVIGPVLDIEFEVGSPAGNLQRHSHHQRGLQYS